MIVCVNGEGQGCCDLCKIINGWHRHWSSSLYYVVNTKMLKILLLSLLHLTVSEMLFFVICMRILWMIVDHSILIIDF